MRDITVLLPTYNNLRHLQQAIISLCKSTQTHFKLYILEANCTDGTKEWLETIENKPLGSCYLVKVFHKNTKSSIEALNYLIDQTKDEDLFLTQDDMFFHSIYQEDWLKVFNSIAGEESQGLITMLFGGGISGPEYLNEQMWVGTWCMYIPRRTINIVGKFDEAMRIGEDVDYSYRVQKAGLILSQCKFWFEHHQQRSSPHQPQDEKTMQEASLYFKKKHNLN